jgi:hypothetical protein
MSKSVLLKKNWGLGMAGGDILARQKILTCTLYKTFFFDVFNFKNSPYFEEKESKVATNKRLVHGGRQNKYLEKILLSCLSGKIWLFPLVHHSKSTYLTKLSQKKNPGLNLDTIFKKIIDVMSLVTIPQGI